MTAITNLPDLRPSLLLDFANSGRVDPRIQCTRASSATCFGPNGVMRTVGANVPSIDYDPATGKCLGLLVESTQTNLALYSHDFSKEVWVKIGASVDVNGRLTEIGTNSSHYLYQAFLISAGEPCTLTVQAKHDPSSPSKRYLTLLLTAKAFGVNVRATFDLENGTFTTSHNPQRASMVRQADGSYMCSVTHTATVTGTTAPHIRLSPNPTDTISPYTGDNASGLYLICANLTKTAAPHSIIRSEGAPATRAADLIQIPLGDWFNPNEGTFVVDCIRNATDATSTIISLEKSGVSSSNTSLRLRYGAAGAIQYIFYSEGVERSFIARDGFNTSGVLHRLAFSYKKGIHTLCANGQLVATSAAGDVDIPSLNLIRLGVEGLGFNYLGGCIGRSVYYPKHLSVEQQERLTAL